MKKTNISLIILSLFMFFSCKDDNVAKIPPAISKQSSQDYLLAEKMFCEVGRIIEEGMNVNDVFKNVTYYMQNSNSLNPDTLNIDFGISTILNGNDCKGEIEIIFAGNYSDSGTVITSTFPVAVTKISALSAALSIVLTSNPSIAAWRAQIGSISVTTTRHPAFLRLSA